MTAKGSGSATPRTPSAKRTRPTVAQITDLERQIAELHAQSASAPKPDAGRIAELERELGMQAPGAPAPDGSPVNGHGSPFPLIDLDDSAEPEPLKRAPLFRAAGKTYSMVTNPPPQWGFEAVALAGNADGRGAESGMAASQVFILRKMLGDEGLRALRDRESIKPEKLTEILATCSRTVYGAMEPPKTS